MKKLFLFFSVLLIAISSYCQVGVGTTTPSSASMLEVSSTSDAGATYKGLMPPRVPNAAARDLINPEATDDGLMVYVQDTGCLQVWTGGAWENVHCNNSSALASDLFISEYVEGSSNNKAIEIANFTGSTVSLNTYKVFISRNGGSSTSDIILNSVTLANGDVYVIKNTLASSIIVAEQTSNLLDFNGNDAIILRTMGGSDIDVIGVPGDSSNYGVDVTLRKKPGIGPTLTYTLSNFNSFSADTFSGLGSHTF